jgi:dipeptidyl aminopeptidase/acylaminoacyl peptidase
MILVSSSALSRIVNQKACVAALLALSNVPFALARQKLDTQQTNSDQAVQTKRSLTVVDSINMTHLIDPPEHSRDAHPQYSPNGKQFLVLTEKGNIETNLRDYSVLVFEAHDLNATPQVVATFHSSSNEDAIKDPRWIDDKHIAFIAANPGHTAQVFVLECHTRKMKRMTAAPNGVVAYALSSDSKRIAYYGPWVGKETETKYKQDHGFTVGDENLDAIVSGTWNTQQNFFQMYLLDLHVGIAQPIRAGAFSFPEGRLRIWLSPDGNSAVTEQPAFFVPAAWQAYGNAYLRNLVHRHPGQQSNIREFGIMQAMLVDMRSGEIKPLIDAPTTSSISVKWSADSHSVIIANTYLPLNINDAPELEDRKSHSALAEVEVPGLSFHKLADIPKDVGWSLSAGASPASFLVDAFEFELQGNEALPPNFPTIKFSKRGTEWTQEVLERSAAGQTVTISEALDRWPKLVELDRATRIETVLFDPNPQFQNLRFGRVEVVHWIGKRGEALAGGLVYPTNYEAGTRYPLVIQTHGFGPDEFLLDGPFTTAFAAQELANKGVAVLQLGDSPLFDRSEGTPDFGAANLSQFESAIDYLDGKGIVDRERVGLVGFSINSYLVRYALLRSQYYFAVATAAEGNDWGYWNYVATGNSFLWQAQNEAPYGGSPWDGKLEAWLQNSISFNYEKIHTPMRLEDDSGASPGLNDWENFVALKRLRRPVDLIIVPHGAHPVVRPWHRLTSQQGNVDWLVFWLKGEEDPDPAKAEQYRRWRDFRKMQSTEKEHHSSAETKRPN